jgi:hypothetical protein
MAYNFLGLVNDVNERVNEVPLTTLNFASARGFYSTAKQAINSSIRHINTQEFEWPFNHITAEDVLVAGETRYQYPYDAKTVDFDTFRIKRSEAMGNSTQKLSLVSYEDYLENSVKQEYEDEGFTLPRSVFRTPDMKFGVTPAPDKDYEIIYEYYRFSTDLILPTDVPEIPEQFRHVLIDGAMYYVYLFRNSVDEAQLSYNQFTGGIKSMRSLYINRYDYLRSTVLSAHSNTTH